MASSISLEYLLSIEGAADGLATLDSAGHVPLTQLPDLIEVYKGVFADATALNTAYPTAETANYAFVTADLVFYYWNDELATPAWVKQTITPANYNSLTAAQKAQVPYIIIP